MGFAEALFVELDVEIHDLLFSLPTALRPSISSCSKESPSLSPFRGRRWEICLRMLKPDRENMMAVSRSTAGGFQGKLGSDARRGRVLHGIYENDKEIVTHPGPGRPLYPGLQSSRGATTMFDKGKGEAMPG